MSCDVGRRCGLGLMLLWLWFRSAAAAPIRPPSQGDSMCLRCRPQNKYHLLKLNLLGGNILAFNISGPHNYYIFTQNGSRQQHIGINFKILGSILCFRPLPCSPGPQSVDQAPSSLRPSSVAPRPGSWISNANGTGSAARRGGIAAMFLLCSGSFLGLWAAPAARRGRVLALVLGFGSPPSPETPSLQPLCPRGSSGRSFCPAGLP